MVHFKKRVVESALRKKGFLKKDSHHRYYRLFVNGKDTGIYTKVSHGGGDVTDFHIKYMAKELNIEKSEFVDLINCPLSKNGFINLLRTKYGKDI